MVYFPIFLNRTLPSNWWNWAVVCQSFAWFGFIKLCHSTDAWLGLCVVGDSSCPPLSLFFYLSCCHQPLVSHKPSPVMSLMSATCLRGTSQARSLSVSVSPCSAISTELDWKRRSCHSCPSEYMLAYLLVMVLGVWPDVPDKLTSSTTELQTFRLNRQSSGEEWLPGASPLCSCPLTICLQWKRCSYSYFFGIPLGPKTAMRGMRQKNTLPVCGECVMTSHWFALLRIVQFQVCIKSAWWVAIAECSAEDVCVCFDEYPM